MVLFWLHQRVQPRCSIKEISNLCLLHINVSGSSQIMVSTNWKLQREEGLHFPLIFISCTKGMDQLFMFVEVDMWLIWLKGMHVFVHESTKGEFNRAFSFT